MNSLMGDISKKLKEICQIQENISSSINVLFLKSDTAAQLSRMAEDNVKTFRYDWVVGV